MSFHVSHWVKHFCSRWWILVQLLFQRTVRLLLCKQYFVNVHTSYALQMYITLIHISKVMLHFITNVKNGLFTSPSSLLERRSSLMSYFTPLIYFQMLQSWLWPMNYDLPLQLSSNQKPMLMPMHCRTDLWATANIRQERPVRRALLVFQSPLQIHFRDHNFIHFL